MKSHVAPRRSAEEAGKLTIANEALAIKIAKDMFSGERTYLLSCLGDMDDAIQIARQWLYLACLRWDETKAKLSTFATWYIRGGLLTAVRRGGVVREPDHRSKGDNFVHRLILSLDTMDDTGTLECVSYNDDPSLTIEQNEQTELALQQIKLAFSGMKRRERNAFLAYYLDGRTFKEIGVEYGISKQAVAQMLLRVKERAQRRLREIG